MGFAVLERRLKPGAAEAYLAAIAALCRAMGDAPGLVASTTYLSDDDPPIALNVAEWRHRTDHLAARKSVPAAIGQAPSQLAAPGGEGWVWFEQRYLIREIGARVGRCASTRFALAPGQARTYVDWAASGARAGLAAGHLAGLLLLERGDEPGQFLALEEFPDEAARVEHRRHQPPPDRGPGRVDVVGAFRGSVALQWPLAGELGGPTWVAT